MKAPSAQQALSLLNKILFKLGWVICLFGGDKFAVLVTAVICIIHTYLFKASLAEWRLILTVSLVGVLFDSVLINLGFIQLSSNGVIGSFILAPLWLMCMWVLFSTMLCHSFSILHFRLRLAAILAFVVIPPTYFFAAKLANFSVTPLGLLCIAVGWGAGLPLALLFARKLNRSL